MRNSIIILFLVGIFLPSCMDNDPDGDWIRGSKEERLKTIEKHFRGLDNAMIEVGHRYQELFWAGRDKNWLYARYQLDKIKLAIQLAVERRPKRSESSAYFLDNDLPLVLKNVEMEDSSGFQKSFQLLTTACNTCHVKENVPFFKITIPVIRASIIGQ